MLKEPTTLVLGAGASLDLAFPLGPSLSTQIQKECRGVAANGADSSLSKMVQRGHLGNDIPGLRKRAELVWKGLSTSKSVDDFLYRVGDDALLIRLAKAAIALTIVRCEQSVPARLTTCWESSPFRLSYHNGETVTNTRFWLATLLAQVFSGVTSKPSLEASLEEALNHLSVITFNYDRSFEYFLGQFLRNGFGLDENRAATFVAKNLRVFHIYGKIASQVPLEQQFIVRSGQFDSTNNWSHILEGADGIRTIHETTEDRNDLDMAKAALRNTNRILFIGNSYIEQNMALLQGATKRCRVSGTAYLLSAEHLEQAVSLTQRFFNADFCSIKGEWTAEKMLCDIVETL